MSKEKIVKLQAREALKGNISVMIAAMGMIALTAVTLLELFYLLIVALGTVDIETDDIRPGAELLYFGSYALCSLLAVGAAPMINGFMRMAGDVAVKGKCEIGTLFYYYKSPLRFFKSVVIDMGLLLIFSALTFPADAVAKLLADYGELVGIAVAVAGVIWKILVFLFFIHYPLAIFALDDSRGIIRYLFCCTGFSFRHSGALIGLLFSMLGWIALCFFVVPALYVIPYLEVALMNSARWLLSSSRTKGTDEAVNARFSERGPSYSYRSHFSDI